MAIHAVNTRLNNAPANVPYDNIIGWKYGMLFSYSMWHILNFILQYCHVTVIYIAILHTVVFAHGKNIPSEKAPNIGPPVTPNTEKDA